MKELQILIKPVSDACDIQCRYCFYKDETSCREKKQLGHMSNETVSNIVSKALQESECCVFGFQGGEPLLAGIEFYKRFTDQVEKCQRQYRRKDVKKTVYYTIQTNGILLDEHWIRFFKEKNFLVGVSLDGVRKTHDENRVDREGKGTFSKVFSNIRALQTAKIPFHILCVLNAQTAEKIGAVYRFFVRKGFLEQQYIPCLDPIYARRGQEQYSLTPELYERALKELFDVWFEDKIQGKEVHIRQFDNYISMLLGGQPEACTMYGRCSMQNVIEADGSIYPCDFYALDEYEMGNINDNKLTFSNLLNDISDKNRYPFFAEADRRDDRCKSCRWYPLCRGGCKRDCEWGDTQETLRQNYYCQAYQKFFSYTISRMEWLAGLADQ